MLVDTSVWVDYFRGTDTPEARRLAAALARGERICICGLILTEILQGIPSAARRQAVRDLFQPLVYLPISQDAYCLAADLFLRARRRGRLVRSTIDCIIAACALDCDVPVLHRDRDYDILASVSDLEITAP